jgi:hypothetical protein
VNALDRMGYAWRTVIDAAFEPGPLRAGPRHPAPGPHPVRRALQVTAGLATALVIAVPGLAVLVLLVALAAEHAGTPSITWGTP